MKLVGKGFSVNGKPNLKGTTVPYSDSGEPLGIEWDLDLSKKRDRALLVQALVDEELMTLDEARIAVRELVQGLQRQRDQIEAQPADLDQPPQQVMSARFPGLVDLVMRDGQVCFLLLEGQALRTEEATDQYIPPPADAIQWLLPDATAVIHHYGRDTELKIYTELLAHLKTVSRLAADGDYQLLALWIIHSYLLERAAYSPYPYLYGDNERGKSRILKAAIYCAYRGIVTETLQEANLFRWSNDLGATLGFDVKDLWRKAEKRGAEDILLQRFEKGAKVARVLWPERGPFKDTAYFDIFGASIVASNELPIEPFLSRCIIRTPPEAAGKYPNVQKEDGLPIRERLVALRARWLSSALPDVDKPAPGRLGDILQPLAQVAAAIGPDVVASFSAFAGELYRERMAERAGSREAAILEAVSLAWPQQENGKIPVDAIREAYNSGLPERQQISRVGLGRRLRALGFEGDKLAGKKRGIVADGTLLDAMLKKYGLAGFQESVQSVQVSSAVSEPDSGQILDTFGLTPGSVQADETLRRNLSQKCPDTNKLGPGQMDGLDTFLEPLDFGFCDCPNPDGPPMPGEGQPVCACCGQSAFWCSGCGGCRLCAPARSGG